MRRFLRRLVRLAVAGFCLLSLLTSVAAGWVWWRTRRDEARVLSGEGGAFVDLQCVGGDVRLFVVRGWRRPPDDGRGRAFREFGPRPGRPWGAGFRLNADPPVRVLGAEWGRGTAVTELADGVARWPPEPWRLRIYLGASSGADGRRFRNSPPMPFWKLSAPLWMPATVFALPPQVWVGARGRRAWAARRRRRLGRCRRCGYDLRGSPSGICSECGTVSEGVPNRRGLPRPDGGFSARAGRP